MLQEQQGGKASADLIVGLGADERLARSGSTFLVYALGSTVGLATSGAVKTNYGYDPYGVSTATGTASTSTFQFTGREACCVADTSAQTTSKASDPSLTLSCGERFIRHA